LNKKAAQKLDLKTNNLIMSRNTFAISFYTRNYKEKDGLVPIYMCITINGKKEEISTQKWIAKDRWNKSGKALGHRQDSKDINLHLDTLKKQAFEIRRELIDKNETITAEKIKNKITGKETQSKTLLQVFEYHNLRMSELIGKDYAQALCTSNLSEV
jgi:hypothetical protein